MSDIAQHPREQHFSIFGWRRRVIESLDQYFGHFTQPLWDVGRIDSIRVNEVIRHPLNQRRTRNRRSTTRRERATAHKLFSFGTIAFQRRRCLHIGVRSKIMGYFTSIADHAFKVSPEGKTLFYLGGPWSRPLVIEDEAQHRITYAKHLWMQRAFLTVLILGQPFLFMAIPSVTGKAIGFITYGAAIMLIQWCIQRIIFRQELRQCERLSNRHPLRDFYAQMGERHSEDGIMWRLVGCVAFVLCGAWIAFGPTDVASGVGVICSLFFGACGVGWWYALRLKRAGIQEANKASHHNPLPASSSISQDRHNLNPESKPRPR